jgi:hypothetical protein
MQRDEYVRRMKEDLDRLNALAAGWAESARSERAELRFPRERQLAMLRSHRERAARRLFQFEGADDDAWLRAALDLDQAWREMREAYGIARLYFESQAGPFDDAEAAPHGPSGASRLSRG